MRKQILPLLFISFLLISWQSKPWIEYKSYEGKFTIQVPGGEMQEEVNVVKTYIGEITYHSFIYKTTSKDADNLVYLVSYCDYPKGTIHSDSLQLVEEFFDATVETAVKSVDGELLYVSDVSTKGFPGKHWRVDYKQGQGVIKTKSFLVQNRYYSIQTIMLKEKSLNASTERFMDSFRFFEPSAFTK